jgi:hypothetical protein
MEENLYDEFGNYIGPDLSDEVIFFFCELIICKGGRRRYGFRSANGRRIFGSWVQLN